MIKAVFIDIDNTLLDFDAYVKSAMKNGFQKFHLGEYNEDVYRVFERINLGMWRKLEEGSITFEELMQTRWNNVFAALNISFDGCRFEKYFRECLFGSAIPIDGAKNLLDYLKDRYVLCVASNGPYEQQINRLKTGNMLSYFSNCFISEKVGASKPSKEFFSRCIFELNEERKLRGESEILPSEIMMIGDSLTADMAGAIDSGLKTCFFDKRQSGKTIDLPIDCKVDALEEIRGIL